MKMPELKKFLQDRGITVNNYLKPGLVAIAICLRCRGNEFTTFPISTCAIPPATLDDKDINCENLPDHRTGLVIGRPIKARTQWHARHARDCLWSGRIFERGTLAPTTWFKHHSFPAATKLCNVHRQTFREVSPLFQRTHNTTNSYLQFGLYNLCTRESFQVFYITQWKYWYTGKTTCMRTFPRTMLLFILSKSTCVIRCWLVHAWFTRTL